MTARTAAGRKQLDPNTAAGRLEVFIRAHANSYGMNDLDGWLSDLDQLAEAAAPAGLDVGKIAQILRLGNIGCEAHGMTKGAYHLASDHKEDADFIAAEYARLAEEPSDER